MYVFPKALFKYVFVSQGLVSQRVMASEMRLTIEEYVIMF